MKVFGWIQCKLRNSNSSLLKDSGNVSGNNSCLSLKPSWNNQQDYLRPKNSSKGKIHPEYEFEEYLSEAKEEAFPGFLTIGTLNMESIPTEPTTPTFSLPLDETPHEENMEVGYEVGLINEELEKFLKTESKNEWFGETKACSEAKTFHPLEGYLCTSSYDLSASKEEAGKKANTDLSVIVEEKQDQAIRKYKSPACHMRRMLNALQTSHKKNAVVRDGESTESPSTNRKFHKIQKLFGKKVHPEELTAVAERKSHNKATQSANASREYFEELWQELGQDTFSSSTKLSQNAIMKPCTPLKKMNDTNLEHWIRSDEDYLVLELGQN